jgi:hypothetical protein
LDENTKIAIEALGYMDKGELSKDIVKYIIKFYQIDKRLMQYIE